MRKNRGGAFPEGWVPPKPEEKSPKEKARRAAFLEKVREMERKDSMRNYAISAENAHAERAEIEKVNANYEAILRERARAAAEIAKAAPEAKGGKAGRVSKVLDYFTGRGGRSTKENTRTKRRLKKSKRTRKKLNRSKKVHK
jgi:hypothetical protein